MLKLEEDDKHNLSIADMGDFEKFHRSKKIERLRVPALTDQENLEINRVFFGNPYKLLNVQGKNSSISQPAVAGGPNTGGIPPAITSGVFDERAFEHAGGQDTPMPM